MSTSAIQHIVAMPTDVSESGQSLYQGFSLALYPDYLSILTQLISFPHDLLEPGLARERLVGSKMAGSNLNIRMIRADLIDADHAELRDFPTVVWSTSKSVDTAEEHLSLFKYRPLHLTLGEHASAISIVGLTKELVYKHLLALAERAAEVDEQFSTVVEAMQALPPVDRNEGQLPFVPRLHNCTGPMAEVLRLYGYQFENGKPIEPTVGNVEHIGGMLDMAKVIDRLRQGQPAEILGMRKNDGVIFCPSIYAFMYRVDQWNQLFRKLDRPQKNFAKSLLLRNKGYSNAQVEVDKKSFNPYEVPVLREMLVQRQFELLYFTTLIAVLAVNQFVPAFRLPNAVNLHHDKLSEIYSLVNSRKSDRLDELNRRMREYGDAIRSEVGDDLWDAAFGDRERLLLICDFPAEWLPVNLVPAMFRYEMSRIPSTPGNVTSHVMLNGPRVTIPRSALTKVRIIRSFDSDDPIRDHLSKAIEHYPLDELEIEFVDVRTSVELIDAMNQFNGALLIFDCHGNHGGKSEHAWLNIGKERVDVWQLANVARMPPIVLLAACSTHPLDGSHASVANGFLRSGVLSVLGTFAPVHSVHTAVLVARLLYRIAAFLPLITKRRPCTWREIVSGFFRMSYATDVLRDLAHSKLITAEQYKEIHFEANTSINSGEPDWVGCLQKGAMKATAKNETEIKKIWTRRFQFVETMLFTQLGRPENIIIMSDAAYLDDGGQPEA